MPSCNPPAVPFEDRIKMEAMLAKMFPDLHTTGDLLEYNLLALPVVSQGMEIDLNRMESSEIHVHVAPVQNHMLVLEITISNAVRGTGKKPRKKEFFYTLEIEPIEFVSRKQFKVEITTWLERKKQSCIVENDGAYLKTIFNLIHKRVLQDWLRQFETSTFKGKLDEILLYQLLYHFFEPDDEAEIVETH